MKEIKKRIKDAMLKWAKAKNEHYEGHIYIKRKDYEGLAKMENTIQFGFDGKYRFMGLEIYAKEDKDIEKELRECIKRDISVLYIMKNIEFNKLLYQEEKIER